MVSSILPKNERKQVDLRYHITLGRIFWFVFLEEFRIQTSPFEINWPLAFKFPILNLENLNTQQGKRTSYLLFRDYKKRNSEKFQCNLNLYKKRPTFPILFLDSFVQMNSIDFFRIVESFLNFFGDEGSVSVTNWGFSCHFTYHDHDQAHMHYRAIRIINTYLQVRFF